MKRFGLLALLVLGLIGTVSGQTLKAHVMLSEPLGYIDASGSPAGEHVEYLKAIARKAGIGIDIEVVEKSRLFGSLKSGAIDLAIFFRSPKWDDSVEYIEKIREIRIAAISLAGKPLQVYEDLYKAARIGTLPSLAVGGRFDSDSRIRKFPVSDYGTMMKLLSAKRIDVGVGNSIVLAHQISKAGIRNAIDSKSLTLGRSEQWLHISGKSRHLSLIPRLREAVLALQKDGTLDSILTAQVGDGWKALNRME